MKILIAKTAGFCMGVRRAVELVLDAPHNHENPICTYGPLIHNPQVLDLLEEKGINILSETPDCGSGTVLIRAHGVPPLAKQNLKEAGFNVIDATCPRVIRVQTIIRKHAKKGYASIIIGDKNHPEVVGLLGFAGEKGYVVDSLDDLDSLPAFDEAIIVAQTTQDTEFFENVKNWAGQKFPHYKIFDTICDSTAKRQAEVRQLADSVDAVIVVGGRNSGNTQRLAEIARRTGKPTYHVESESELDVKSLSSAQNIGISAGASTPNWIINRIYRTLEILPYTRGQGLRRVFVTLLRALLPTNIYVSTGAGCLCYACTKLLGITDYFPHVLISILYVQSMHILNNLSGTKAAQYNDPERASLYKNNMVLLSMLAFIAGGAGLMTAYTLGMVPFLILAAMSIMGLSYNMKLIPAKFTSGKYRRIKDIPGSKTILIATAWGVVTSILPPLAESKSIGLSTTIVFLWSISLVFARTAFFDILDMQGDRIVGKETIPLLLGEERTLTLLKSMLVFAFLILLASSAVNLTSNLGIALAICPVFMFIVLSAHQRGRMLPGTRLEFLMETSFVIAGIVALIWSAFTG
jgi:4-hydroxy-3-methylbut-2-enyl diphosphate reductase